MITSFTPVDVHHTTLHTAAGLISLPIAAAPHHHTAQHRRSLLTAGAGAGCCWWLLLVGVGWCCCCVGKLVAAAALRSARANTLLSPTRPHQGWPVPATTPTNTQQHSTAATTLQQQPGPPLSQHWCCTPGCVSTSGWCGYWPSLARRAGRAAGGSVSCTGGTTAATSGPGRHCSMQHAAWGRVGTCAGWRVVTLGTGHRRWWLESPSVGGWQQGPPSGQWAGGGGGSFGTRHRQSRQRHCRHSALPRHTHHHIKEGNQVNVTITEVPCDHP